MMTIKQQKLVLHFLEMLEPYLENRIVNEINSNFLSLLSRKELVGIVLWLFTNYQKSDLTDKSDAELLTLIADDSNVLSFVIYQWKEDIKAVPKMTKEEVDEFFDKILFSAHYLRDKPVEEWDSYDVSNYYSLLFKHGKTQRVYAIFTVDVEDEDKYAVTTKPSFYFDTKAEAEEELERICIETKQHKSDFKIHTLWKINT